MRWWRAGSLLLLIAAAQGAPAGCRAGLRDGEVLVVDAAKDVAYLNLGTRRGVRMGMRFLVWRHGKGGLPEDIAFVRVVTTEATWCAASVERRCDPQVAVCRGMSVSNPFYDPFKRLRVCLGGKTSSAIRRAAEAAGAELIEEPGDSVDVVILGAAPVATVADPKRAALLAEAWRGDVGAWALAQGAMVVSEPELAGFTGPP